MWFTRISINNPVFATMMMAALLVLGLFSYSRLSIEQFPDVTLPLKRLQGFFANTGPGRAGRSVSQYYDASAHARIDSGLSVPVNSASAFTSPKSAAETGSRSRDNADGGLSAGSGFPY